MARPSDRGERNEALRLLVAAISGILLLIIIGGAGLYYSPASARAIRSRRGSGSRTRP